MLKKIIQPVKYCAKVNWTKETYQQTYELKDSLDWGWHSRDFKPDIALEDAWENWLALVKEQTLPEHNHELLFLRNLTEWAVPKCRFLRKCLLRRIKVVREYSETKRPQPLADGFSQLQSKFQDIGITLSEEMQQVAHE